MMDLNTLRTMNPNLRLYSVLDPEFAPYGRVLNLPGTDALAEALAHTEIPETGNRYVASDPALEALHAIREIRQRVYGDLPVQAGFCNGNSSRLNAEEYHKCSEVNFTTTGLVLLLALPEDLEDLTLDSGKVTGFLLPRKVLIELHPRVLHFAPCRIDSGGFNCLVVLSAGTNAPLDHAPADPAGEDRLLRMTNKWLLCHPDSPQAENGAYVGIKGENLSVAFPTAAPL